MKIQQSVIVIFITLVCYLSVFIIKSRISYAQLPLKRWYMYILYTFTNMHSNFLVVK